MVNSYKVQALNVNSISKIHKRHFLAQFINLHKPDLLLLSETCLQSRHKIRLDKYKIIRTDMALGRRGTAILIKENIEFKPFSLPFIPNFEYTAVMLKSGSAKLFIFSIYIHSNQLVDTDDFASLFNHFGHDDFVLLGGDFNAKHTNWLNYNNNSNGVILNAFLNNSLNFSSCKLISSTRPSRFDSHSFSFIDFFLITSNILSDPKARTYPFESDHLAVEAFFSFPQLKTSEPPKILNYNKTNWLSVHRDLKCNLLDNFPPINKNISIEEIDAYVNYLEEKTLQIVTSNTPIVKSHPNYKMQLDHFTLRCINERKALRRRWFRTGRSDTLLKSFIDRITKIIAQLITAQYEDKLNNDLSNLKPGSKIFKDIKRIAGISKLQPPLLQGCDDEEASAELLGKHFAEIHNLSNAATSSSEECPPNAIVQNLLNSHTPTVTTFDDNFPADASSSSPSSSYSPFIRVDEVATFIKTRKNQKSSGEKQISNFIIKKLPHIFTLYLTILINHCLNLSYFPNKWKNATVTPVPKGCSYTADPNQYRPISLLSPLSKIYEMAIKKQLNMFSDSLNVLNKFQFGFVPGKSTSHAITLLLEEIHDASHKKLPTLAVTIDLQKAFDSVWINGLIFKLVLLKFPMQLITVILNFLVHRTFRVKYNNKFSSSFPILAGVPQGSILGPILFNIFLSDFPIYFDPNIRTIFFADDILIYTSKKHIPSAILKIENYLQIITEYFKIWMLPVNYAKCNSILFRTSDKHIPKSCKIFKDNSNLVINFNSHSLSCVSNLKYLGIIFNNKLSIIPHVKKITTLANAAFGCLRRIFLNSKISIQVKILAYKQLIRPIILYGFVGWCHISSNQMGILRRLERKILYKCIPRKIAYVRVGNLWKRIPKNRLYIEIGKLKRLDTVLVKNFVKFLEKLQYSDINELSSLTSFASLLEKFNMNNARFKFKCFPPSLLYYTHLQNLIYENGCLRFYNRRYNSLTIDDYVYDLMEPD